MEHSGRSSRTCAGRRNTPQFDALIRAKGDSTMTNEKQDEKKKRKRPRGTGAIFKRDGSRFLWVGYIGPNGKYMTESSGSEKRIEAQNFLNKRIEAVSGRNFLGPRVEKITIDELYDDLLSDYRINGQFVLWPQRCWNAHLKSYFGGMKAASLGTTQISEYVEKRRSERAAESTINRELALLRRAFSLGFDAEPPKVMRVPKFHRFIVSEKGRERKGFAEESKFRKLMDAAAGQVWLQGLMALGYTYGLRKGELLGNREKGTQPMRCEQVDLLNNTIILYSGETKNDEPRTVMLTEECRMLVGELRRGKQPEDFLFTRKNGEIVRDFRGTWDALTARVGLPGLYFHDLRRSSVRNMIRRGVPEKVAMEISGHKTRSVFDRYNIVSESDLLDASRKVELGAKAEMARLDVIDSSLTVAPNQGSDEVAHKGQKPS
jgi:integrase